MTASPYREYPGQSKGGSGWTEVMDNLLLLREALDSEEWRAPAKYHAFIEHHIASHDKNEAELLAAKAADYGPLANLRKWYDFRGGAEVERFLKRNPMLIYFLLSAHDRIHKYFGPDAHVALDVIKDGEIDDNERLFAFVQTDLSADDALERLYEFYEQWWLDRLSKVQPKMSIDVEFA